jgi:hypothetical protein
MLEEILTVLSEILQRVFVREFTNSGYLFTAVENGRKVRRIVQKKPNNAVTINLSN